MEQRQSGRADGRAGGRGWSGRGDSAARRRSERDERFERDRARHLAAAGADEAERAAAAFNAPSGDAADRTEEDLLRGSGDAPWVRLSGESTGPPPGGRPGASAEGHGRAAPPLPDLSALLAVLEGVRGMVPRELTAQVNALIRELLLTLRALIDWYLERLDGRPSEPEVEEIPID